MTDHELILLTFIMNFIIFIFTIVKVWKDSALNTETLYNQYPTHPKPPPPPAPPSNKCCVGCGRGCAGMPEISEE